MSKLWRTPFRGKIGKAKTRSLLQRIEHGRRFGLMAGLVGLLVATPTLAEQHSLADIARTAALDMEQRAREAGYSNIEVEVRPLDGRLNLPQCPRALKVLPTTGQRVLGPVSSGIHCAGSDPWTLYVRGQVSAIVASPVLTEAIPRGSLISARDIALDEKRVTSDFGGIITDVNDIIGMEARKNLNAGQPVRFSDLRAPELISRGQSVELVSAVAGLQVRMEGKAVNNGAAGDLVWVDNISSGKRVQGTVAPDGTVVVQ